MNLTLIPITKSLAKLPFDCGYKELNDYLRHYALKNDTLLIGKTFVALTESEGIAGYVTLSTAQIASISMPEEIRATLPRYPIPAFRIGKLAVSKEFQGSGIGRWLLSQTLKKALEISQNVGIYAVLVDAIDDKAKEFYQKYGFIPFTEHPLTLFLPLATIQEASL